MANSDKNIVITPNTGSASMPTIVFTGGSATPGTLTVNDAGTLSFDKQFISSVATGTAPFAVTSTTRVANLNVASAGNADTVTNGVYTTGDQTIAGIKTFSSTISGSITGNAGTVTNGVYQNSYGSFQAVFTSNINANTNRNAGVFGSYASAATNTPTTAGILWNGMAGTDGSGDGAQIWQDYVTNNLYARQRWGGNFGTWLTILSSSNYNSYSPTLTGTGASGTWGINITGNAATVTNGVYTTGTQTIGGVKTFSSAPVISNATENLTFANSGTTKRGILGTMGDNDFWFIGGGATASNAGFLEISTGDDGQGAGAAEPIYVRQYGPGSPIGGTLFRSATLLDASGNTTFPGSMTVSTDVRAPIFYDSVSPTYYCDPGGSSIFAGSITISQNNANGGGIVLADDGDIVDLNDGYCAMRFSLGVRIHAGNRTGAAVVALTSGGAVLANADVTAYSSDQRLKTNVVPIENSLEKVKSLTGATFDWIEAVTELGFNPTFKTNDVGLLAQQVQAVLPQAVAPAPFDNDGNGNSKSGQNYLTVKYEKLVPLLVEAIKEQDKKIERLERLVEQLLSNK